ncbi:PQQ-binding-like beta-propeller repeat protein [Streptomyces sp. NPDC053427]|uniref:outer membrane protein assembly factor BamB family protein n=1 Tax=Streptomyces sp. NPDC053427 TaxID=3365701 RepID=UPI0037CEDE00
MSEIGEVLSMTALPFGPSEVMWSGNGQSLATFGLHPTSVPFETQMLAVLNAAAGEARATEATLDTRSVAVSPDGLTVAVAGRLGAVETIREFVEFLDCSDVPPDKRKECQKYNQEKAGWRIRGYKPPPDRVSVLAVESDTVLWRRVDDSAAVRHVRYSPDGKLLAASGQGLLLLDTASGGVRLTLDSLSSPLLPTAFSGDSKRLAAADSARMVLIDVTAGATQWVTPLPEPIAQFAFAQDDSALVVSTERQVFTLDAGSGDIRTTVELQDPLLGGHPTALSADGRRLVRAGPESMTLWDVADGSRRFETPVGNSAQVRFNPVLPEIAIASAGGVKVVNSGLGTTVWEQDTDSLTNLAFSPDGQRLALCGRSHVRVHNMNPTDVSHQTLGGPVEQIALTSFPDPLAVVASHDPEAKASVFHADTGALVLAKSHPGRITSLEVSPDGRHFATGGTDGGARLFTTLTGDKRWEVAHNAPVNSVAFLHADGDADLVTASGDKTARRLARATGEERWQFKHPQAVTLVATSPDGRWIATACADRSTRILNPATGEELFRFRHDGKVRAIAFDPQSKLLAAGSDDDAVLIIDAATGRVLGQSLHTREVTAVAFSHDGKLLATAGKDQAVHLVDVGADPPKLARGLSFPQPITRLAFHPAEPQLALVNDEPAPTVTITDSAEGTKISRLPHPATIHDLTYSPDGKLIATACADQLARVYRGRREP